MFSRLTIIAILGAAVLVGCKKSGSADELFASAQQLQQEEKFDQAIKTYRQIIGDFPKSRQAANSQFMIGYVYANHIHDEGKARSELQTFLADFATIADSGLIAGARFELEYMGKSIDEIPLLAGLGSADSTGADSTLSK